MVVDDAQDEGRKPSRVRSVLLATAAAAWALVALLTLSGQDGVSGTAPAAGTISTVTPSATTAPARSVAVVGPAASIPQTDSKVIERELTAEGMSREVNNWRWPPSADGEWPLSSF